MYRSPSPLPYISSTDPFTSPGPYPATQPAGSTQINPGSITYTTSTGPDGRIVYHPFKAVPASYQTPSGIVSGIQWVPAEATQILPAGAQPATAEFADAWTRSSFNSEEQKALKEWQRGEEKRRRKEEKESARMLRDKQARSDEAELRFARERDAVNRERRKSFNQGSQYTFPATTPPAPYPGSPNPYGGVGVGYAGSNPGSAYGTSSPNMGYARERKYSTGGGILPDVERQFAEMGLDRNADPLVGTRLGKYETTAERTRRLSGNFGPERPLTSYGQGVAGVGGVSSSVAAGGFAPPARPYSRNAGSTYAGAPAYTNPSPNLRSAELGGYSSQAPMPSSPYHGPYRAPSRAPSRGPSPIHDPYLRSTSPMPLGGDVYPPGHVMEGQPIPSLLRSRPTTPSRMMGAATPGGTAYPTALPFPSSIGMASHIGSQGQLSTPECFHRPINAAHPYTPFEAMKVMDMDGFLESIPRMPAVLQPHDVYLEDWNRLMEDIALAWSGRLPVPATDGRVPKRATLTANLLGLWNDQFFERRGIEIVIYKGRQRRSGSKAGVVDLPMPSLDDTDSLSSSSSSSDSDDDNDDPRYGANPANPYGGGGYYGRPGYGTMDGGMEERQRRIAAKADKKRRKKEKKIRKKAKAIEKKYALYLTSIPTGIAGGIAGGPVGHAGSMVGGYAPY
ncbi:hypothetical protein D9758_001327 [Tetrapyrgos nigripes]|uniref:Uncharacterized protein n=1 Tax=Tetrapyrgos nigripes TaxID=182062 RepID=A0A8H5GRR5_9AGAR|nr:hypothetical protein D9758_001327 [Tetrapyrgos nigripes]